jgi:ATP/ADP translocase
VSEQLAWTIVAATVGFVAAVWFCVGNALNAAENILLQATPFWDFNQHLARALVAQRAQYIVGAALLFVSFAAQLTAALSSSDRTAALPGLLASWCSLLAAVLTSVSVASWLAYKWLSNSTLARVLAIEAARRAEDERTANTGKEVPI